MPQGDVGRVSSLRTLPPWTNTPGGEETGDARVVVGVEPVAPRVHDPLRLGRAVGAGAAAALSATSAARIAQATCAWGDDTPRGA